MLARSALCLLVFLAVTEAGPADDVFARAVARQGNLRRANINDLYLRFDGHAVIDKADQALFREYWYRSKDRAFHLLTKPKATRQGGSERGVDGNGYWDRIKERTIALSPGNRDHRQLIEGIDEDRRDFERVVALVLLSRLQGARITLARNVPVKLLSDQPWSANLILGRDRQAHQYHVLDVQRDGEPRLRLFVRTSDYTVRKAIQYHAQQPAKPEFVYYFAFGPPPEPGRPILPRYFTVHSLEPTDKATRKSSGIARGEIEVRINEGLKPTDLRPASAGASDG